MREVVTMPVTVLLQLLPVTVGSVPAQTAALRLLMIFGLANPMDTWNPAGPYSWKKLGSPIRRKESWAFWPSRVLVWSHSSPLAIRSAPGVATTPYLPGIRLATTAWPASGDGVKPSDSNNGQVTIVPVMPVCVGSGMGRNCPGWAGSGTGPGIVPIREFAEIGQASSPETGSFVPAKLFDNGWLNMS